mmetsp:Transcript_22031/g.31960  ORF Transcript_22031/g.31960 Transcript_22031/m.31960 type:complete len:589 (+) Transcript_22031:1294-3060(+)
MLNFWIIPFLTCVIAILVLIYILFCLFCLFLKSHITQHVAHIQSLYKLRCRPSSSTLTAPTICSLDSHAPNVATSSFTKRYNHSWSTNKNNTRLSYFPQKNKTPPSSFGTIQTNTSHRFKSTAILTEDTPTNTIPFLLADIGEGITQVELLQWYVSPGDTIHQFDLVCQVQSDKATVDITSRYDGVVTSVEGEVGDVMNVGSPLIYMDVQGDEEEGGDDDGNVGSGEKLHNVNEEEDRLSIPPSISPPVVSSSSPFATSIGNNEDVLASSKVLATPAVRKLVKEHNLNLSSVKGTGPKGRILKSDILTLLQTRHPQENVSNVEDMTLSSSSKPITSTIIQTRSKEKEKEEEEIVPIRGYHRLMIQTMESSLTIPHMVYSDEINMTSLHSFRSTTLKSHRISYLPFMIKAASLSLAEYPILNSTLRRRRRKKEEEEEEYELVYRKYHNVGVAMDSPRGLVVPVVRDCGNKSILEISEDLLRLQSLAKEGTLTKTDLQNPTFALSNIGTIGGTYMSPVVVPPTVAIGAMGKITRVPRFISDSSNEVEGVYVMPISWGGDHRVIDGATMARFSNLWKDYLEDPLSMLLYMK